MPDANARYGSDITSIAAGSRAVELLPEGTGRLGTRTGIGPRHALVVDRTPSMRTINSTLLQVHGFTVAAFDTVEGAVQACRERVPDVVVMEPHAMGVDPLDVLRDWCGQVSPAAPPVVWCTTVTPSRQHLEAGADLQLRGVVIKPFRLEALAALVIRVVRTEERERRLRDRGVDLRRHGATLPPDTAALWLQVESQLAEEHVRPLSLVSVSTAVQEVRDAVRRVVRNVDLLALLDEDHLAVLLPDVDAAGAEVVARRVVGAAEAAEPVPAVRAVTRRDGESAEELRARALGQG
jgi:two-component system, chemotaxis family, chemotaxis protein CheY